MAEIIDINENWEGHSGTEVEAFLKSQISQIRSSLASLASEKFGDSVYRSGTIYFYDEAGGTVIGSVTLSGTIYNITVGMDVDPVFSVLTGDTNKYITITPSTTAGALGEEGVAFTENYTYLVAIDSGTGYISRINGNIAYGSSATFDIRSFMAVGVNRVRISVTGTESNQTKTTILTATLTSLSLNCTHSWYTPWYEGQDYIINNIYFSGSISKTLHVKIGEEEFTKNYRSNENYATIATSYTIGAEYFPATEESGVHTVELWMTGEGVETEHVAFNIMCLQENDDTPLVCINSASPSAVNFTQATLFRFATVNANKVEITSSVSADNSFTLPSQTLAVETGQIYTFSTALEIDTEADKGTLTSVATAYYGNTEGSSDSVTLPLDNSLAFLATSGAKIYINEALRANTEEDRESLRNTASNAEDTDFPMITSGFTWSTDGHATDPEGHKAFVVPAGCTAQAPTLSPMTLMGEQGVTVEFMIRSRNIADYDLPILTFATTNSSENIEGIIVYPTQILVLGTQERSEVLQSCGLCEDSITHICIVLQKNYAGISGRNLVSVYINGIPNISFSFGSTSVFGSGGFTFGQAKTDGYFYMLRAYDFPLEGQMVKANFLNAIIDGVEFDRELIREKDNILDGATVAYDLCKALGYNCMVIQPDNDADDIPSFNNQATIMSSVRFEYWGINPDWNVLIKNVPVDGQGTTSKKYYRWNLRGKFQKANPDKGVLACEWYYPDSNGEFETTPTFTGKKGYMDGGANGQAHLKIERFTAKKNIASSPQGHKMGACAMYDEVFAQMGIKAHMPNANWRIAVWQYPFMGFRRYSNGTYEFIGLYTAGPDKGCKTSFGYDGETYPACMCIEGPNHDPRGTRFLHPWVDIDFDTSEETLTFGGEEAWDGDFVADLGTDDANDRSAILALYESEWRPAYDLVYHCSQWIDSLQAAKTSCYDKIGLNENGTYTDEQLITAINNNLSAFLGAKTNGVSNMLLSFYDSSYNIVYYRNLTGRFETLGREDNDVSDGLWNILTYLDGYLSTSTPTTAEIKAARRAKFRAEWSNFFDVDSTLAHRNYTLLTGAKDNDAKNSYPFKHLSLAAGGKWMWKQDDLDSILKTDNNGQGTVKYSVEPGDTVSEVQIFQGSDSALWYMIWVEFQTELRNNMLTMTSAMETIARAKNIAGQYLHESVYNLMAYYFFTNSAKYFPITAYQEDRVYGYITPWLLDPTQAYNSVYPLTQALGDRYQEERLWIERRIVYIFSKYRIGSFTGQNAGWGEMAFTLAANTPFTFNITPAIDLYPVANSGGASTGDVQGARTIAGQSTQITLQSSGATTNYIKGVDWIQSLGDLSGLVLTSRGGSNEINFSVVSKRMQSLKVGDADPTNVLFNATSLTVSGECFETIDARNVTTLANAIDLTGCPRLRKALFEGSTATGMILPEGARVDEVSFPNSVPMLFLHTLSSLTQANITLSEAARTTVVGYYFNRCEQLNPLSILSMIKGTQGNSLAYITMIWDGVMEGTQAEIDALIALSEGTYGSVSYINGVLANDANNPLIVRGTMHVAGITQQNYDVLYTAYPDLNILYDKMYVGFVDKRVEEICAYYWGETYDLQEMDENGHPMKGEYEDILNVAPLVGNTYINTSGVETTYINWSSSYLIDISEYDSVKTDRSLQYCAFYNSSEVFISAASIGTTYVTVPEGAKYVRLSGSTSDMEAVVLTGHNINDKDGIGYGGILGMAELEGDDDTIVYSDYFFAASTAISAHGTVPATSARTVRYRVDFEVDGTVTGGAPWDTAIASSGTAYALVVNQYARPANSTTVTSMPTTALSSIILDDWQDSSYWETQEDIINDGDGKYHIFITTTNVCHYLRIGMRARIGTTVTFKIISIDITKVPNGITQAQCAAVTLAGFNTNFALNRLITRFPEMRYFTSMTQLGSSNNNTHGTFSYCTNLEEIDCRNITYIAGGSSGHSSPFMNMNKVLKVSLPNLTRINQYALCSDRGTASAGVEPKLIIIGDKFTTISSQYAISYCHGKNIVIKSVAPPTCSTSLTNIGSGAKFYVPAAGFKSYMASNTWSGYKTVIYPFIVANWYIYKNGSFDYQLHSFFAEATDIVWTLESNSYVTLTSQVGGVATLTASGITSETDSTVDLHVTFKWEGEDFEDTVTIEIHSIDVIEFEDAETKRLCVNSWGDYIGGSTRKVGIRGEITMEQAAAVTSIGTVFKGNKVMEYFDELKYFPNVKALGGDAFDRCTKLRTVDTSNITSVSSGSASGSGYSPFFNTLITVIPLPNVTTLGNYIGDHITATWVIGNSLTTVNQYTFRTMSSGNRSSSYLIYATTPPTLSSGTANAANFTGYIYVPDASYNTYIAHASWSPISARIKKLSEYTGEKPWEALYPEELGLT